MRVWRTTCGGRFFCVGCFRRWICYWRNLGAALHRLPLPGRVASAVVGRTGPYAPWLEVAAALEGRNTKVIREVCKAHQIPADEVNRALLRSLNAG